MGRLAPVTISSLSMSLAIIMDWLNGVPPSRSTKTMTPSSHSARIAEMAARRSSP